MQSCSKKANKEERGWPFRTYSTATPWSAGQQQKRNCEESCIVKEENFLPPFFKPLQSFMQVDFICCKSSFLLALGKLKSLILLHTLYARLGIIYFILPIMNLIFSCLGCHGYWFHPNTLACFLSAQAFLPHLTRKAYLWFSFLLLLDLLSFATYWSDFRILYQPSCAPLPASPWQNSFAGIYSGMQEQVTRNSQQQDNAGRGK